MNQALHHTFTSDIIAPNTVDLFSTQQDFFVATHLTLMENLSNIASCLKLPQTVNLRVFKHAIQMVLNDVETVTAHSSHNASATPFQLQKNTDTGICVEEFNFCHLTPKQAEQRVWDWIPCDCQYAKSLTSDQGCLYRQVLFITHTNVYWYQRYQHMIPDDLTAVLLNERVVKIYQHLIAQQSI